MTTEKHYATCDGRQLKKLMAAALGWLENNHHRVNDLNVFPVPDGDTGTNMLLTVRNAHNEVAEFETRHVGKMAAKLSYGAVMGSRGNSGTILSQICSGFADALKESEVLTTHNLTGALRRATDKAYSGVQHPVEGTMLTVIREITEHLESLEEPVEYLDTMLEMIVDAGWQSVQRTPELLPVLRDAGVVDSGGTGLLYIFEGMLRLIRGESVEVEDANSFEEQIASQHSDNGVVQHPGDNYYDVQFIIKGMSLDSKHIKAQIESMGESAVVVATEAAVKVHVHVADPSRPIGFGIQQGQITDVVVENMLEQYEDYIHKHGVASTAHTLPVAEAPSIEPGDIAVVAVTPGPGFATIFQDMQVTALVNGGQTNNPSVQDFISTFETINTDKIILLPNNKNIILTANQAAELSDREIKVIPTRTVPQGISAMFSYQTNGDFDTVASAMDGAVAGIITGEITKAVRSVEIEGIKVEEGQVIGLLDGKLRTVGDTLLTTAQELLNSADLDDMELITVYYGAEIDETAAIAFADELSTTYPALEVEILYGGQPHYPYILSVE